MLGERLKKYRRERGLTQIQLGALAGIHNITISEWERGHVDGIKLESLNKLATALDVKVSDLIDAD